MKNEIEKREADKGNIDIMNLLKEHYYYSSEKGEISLLYPCSATLGTFEIYCMKGDLFEDIERYDSLPEAEKRINYLLS